MTVKKRIAAIRLIEKLKTQPELGEKLGIQISLEKKDKKLKKSGEIRFTSE